ncbi:MAG TPA: hypothetical protein VHO25_16190, partial [Polyangiaceae bacterium]|nr:hypothetical protein [Polyangiaceae bacterium]
EEAADLIDESIALRILSPSGFRDTAFRTSNQFSAKKQWLDAIKKNWRVFESTVAGLVNNTFDTGDTQVNVPNNTITTLFSLDFEDLDGASGPFGATGSQCAGWLILKVVDLVDSGIGDEMSCEVRQFVQRNSGGNVTTVGAPEVVAQKNFLHTLTFTDGNPFLIRVTKNASYNSTLRCRASGFLHTRTGASP